MNVRTFLVHRMECMCAQSRVFSVIRKSSLVNGVRIHVKSKGQMPSTGGSGYSNARRCITQDNEPNTLLTELFRPFSLSNSSLRSGLSVS